MEDSSLARHNRSRRGSHAPASSFVAASHVSAVVKVLVVVPLLWCLVFLSWAPLLVASSAETAIAQNAHPLLRHADASSRHDLPERFPSVQNHLRWLQMLQDAASNNDTGTNSCNITCCAALTNEELCPTNETTAGGGDAGPFAAIPAAVQYIIIILLLMGSALCAGLVLGLLSLDKTALEIIMEGEDPVNARYARRIYPIRKNGNLLLCTLVLGNVGVNSLLSILMADKAGGLVGFLLSTALIVVFGEILPQAACSMHALRIGSFTAPVVRIMIIVLFPIAFPLGYAMDRLLGEEVVKTYSSGEMLKLLEIQVTEKRMDQDVATAMTGALLYKSIPVANVMTPIERTFMLEVDDRLSFETVAKIFKGGFSRIPVYEIDPNNVIGLLFVKDLIFIDPEDNTRVGDFVEIFGRSLHVVWADDKLGEVLRELKSGRSHMALVRDVLHSPDRDPVYVLKGIITLEDIIEEILGDEIVDETDAYVDMSQSVKVERPENFRWASLRLLDAKIVDETLSFDEARAMAAHLSKNYSHLVELLTDHQLHKLLSETPLSVLPTAETKAGQMLPKDLLYEKDVQTDVCTLIMSGKVTVIAGADHFRSDVSSWSLLGAGALAGPAYAPDFSAYVSGGPCRCLRISRARFSMAVDASALERHSFHDGSTPPPPFPPPSTTAPSQIGLFPATKRKPPPPPPPPPAVPYGSEAAQELFSRPGKKSAQDRRAHQSRMLAALQSVQESPPPPAGGNDDDNDDGEAAVTITDSSLDESRGTPPSPSHPPVLVAALKTLYASSLDDVAATAPGNVDRDDDGGDDSNHHDATTSPTS